MGRRRSLEPFVRPLTLKTGDLRCHTSPRAYQVQLTPSDASNWCKMKLYGADCTADRLFLRYGTASNVL